MIFILLIFFFMVFFKIFYNFFLFLGKHEIYFKNLSIASMDIMEEYGLRVFRFCDSVAHIMRKTTLLILL